MHLFQVPLLYEAWRTKFSKNKISLTRNNRKNIVKLVSSYTFNSVKRPTKSERKGSFLKLFCIFVAKRTMPVMESIFTNTINDLKFTPYSIENGGVVLCNSIPPEYSRSHTRNTSSRLRGFASFFRLVRLLRWQ